MSLRRPVLLVVVVVVVVVVAGVAVPGSPLRRAVGWDVHAERAREPAPRLPRPGEGDLVVADRPLPVEAGTSMIQAAGGLAVVAAGDRVWALDPLGDREVWSWRQEGAEAVALGVAGAAGASRVLVGFAGAGLDDGDIRLRCFDAATGELVWTRTGPFTRVSGNDRDAGFIRGDADVVLVRNWPEVLDLASGDTLPGVASQGIRLLGEGLAVRVDGARGVAASDLRSGVERWARPIPAELVVVEAGAGVLITDQADRLGPLVAFDLQTGRERWTLPDEQRGITYGAVPRGGVVYVLSLFQPGTDLTAVDARTGEQLAQVGIPGVPSLDGPNLSADAEGLILLNNRGSWLPVTWEPAG